MRLEKIAAISEIVSSIAIVATLAYLAIQTQQNTTAVQASVRQAMVAEDREMINQLLDHPVVFIGRSGDGLTDEDLVRVHGNLLVATRSRENQWLQYQAGVIDARTWLTYRNALIGIFSTEFVRSWFRNRTTRGEFDSEFVAMVNEPWADNPVQPTQTVREALGFEP